MRLMLGDTSSENFLFSSSHKNPFSHLAKFLIFFFAISRIFLKAIEKKDKKCGQTPKRFYHFCFFQNILICLKTLIQSYNSEQITLGEKLKVCRWMADKINILFWQKL